MRNHSVENGRTVYLTHSLKKCIHGRSRLIMSKYKQKQQVEQEEKKQIMEGSKNTNVKSCIREEKEEDPYKAQLKSLIALNQNYFQNKLKVSDDGRPNNLKIKIPSKTGGTIYKKDYPHKYGNLGMNQRKEKFMPSKLTNQDNFFDATTYKTQYVPHEDNKQKSQKRVHKSVDQNAPSFYQTNYKHAFMNWGGNNFANSMKPSQRPVITNLPLQNSSVYNSDFNKKPLTKAQSFKPVPCLVIHKDKPRNSQQTGKLNYMTTNNLFHDEKNNSKEQNLKPKTQTLTISGNLFKGKTQYQSQYILSRTIDKENCQKLSLEELQNLMTHNS